MRWQFDSSNAEILSNQTWSPPVSAFQFDSLSVLPIANAWELLRLAIAQRHCANRFVEDCLRGDAAIFSVENAFGKTEATIMLSYEDHAWRVRDVRGFANSRVSSKFDGIARLIAGRCNSTEGKILSATTGHQLAFSQSHEIATR